VDEYERMVIDFVVILAVLLVVALATVVLAAAAIRALRFAIAASAPVLLMITAWVATASNRFVVVEKRARAPSVWESLRA
jgi:hypothetical protein